MRADFDLERRAIVASVISDKVRERFERQTMPEPMSGCTLWIGARLKSGYGEFTLNGSVIRAHRLAWILSGQPLSLSMNVLHKCDNIVCVNVRHLFLGTQADNLEDMARKGRGRRGSSGLPPCVSRNHKRFMASVRIHNVNHYIGTYDTPELAATAVASFRTANAR